MKTLLTLLLTVVSTSTFASVIVGVGPDSNGEIISRGYTNNLNCWNSLKELDIRSHESFEIEYGENWFDERSKSWRALYDWNGGRWIWVCHGEKP